MTDDVTDIMEDLCWAVMRRKQRNDALIVVDSMEVEARRNAYRLARETMRRNGYELGARNRSASPKDWSEDWLNMVISAHEAMRAADGSGEVVRKFSISRNGVAT